MSADRPTLAPPSHSVPPPADTATLAPATSGNLTAAPAPVPGYEIEAELGRGGMGVVYRARQLALGRTVALKMILAGGHAGEADQDRFRTEAEAIARLQHPNIVQIHEIGEHEGLPYFSLEFCPGGSLDRKLNGTPLLAREAAMLVETLARATHAAHQKGILHRDLKPANVLLAEDGTPKLTDFGLAKKLDGGGRTQTGAIVGTPSYMAPEQAVGKKEEVGPACDVYALGVILYECLTGRPPFRAATTMDTLMQVVSEEPVPPRQLNVQVPRDLETICLKCLRKEPRKRYGTAAELADDLRRFEKGEPITARPTGRVERTVKWAKRRPATAALLVVGFTMLAAGVYFTLLLKQERDEARDQRDRAEWMMYARMLTVAERAWEEGNTELAQDVLETCQPNLRGWEYRYLYARYRQRGQRTLYGHARTVHSIAFSPDSKRLATAHSDSTVMVWDVENGKELFTFKEHSGPVYSVCYSPDGKHIASGGEDKKVRVWDAETGRDLLPRREHEAVPARPWLRVCFTSDGKHVAAIAGPERGEVATLFFWDPEKERRGGGMGLGPSKPAPIFSGNGKLLAFPFYGYQKTLVVYRLGSGEPLIQLQQTDYATPLCFSADSKRLATAHSDRTVKVWDVEKKEVILTLQGHTREVTSGCYHCDGNRLVTVGKDQTLKVWETDKGTELLSIRVQTTAITSICFSPDGKYLAGASEDGTVKVWVAE